VAEKGLGAELRIIRARLQLSKKPIGQNTKFDGHSAFEPLTRRSPIIYSISDFSGGHSLTDMSPSNSNASRIGQEERLRLLALSTAILGLVLAPLGLSG